MTVSILNLHCLNAVTDDHENLPSILEEVSAQAMETYLGKRLWPRSRKWRLADL